jgi:Protein of unknown function (DUF2933)
MLHDRMLTYLLAAVAIGTVLAIAGVPLAALLPYALLLACPLMMIFMMRGMGGDGEDHTGHGCEHDPTRKAEPPTSHQR